MFNYILRRILYAIPVLLGVNVITFLLFFSVNDPDKMALQALGTKHQTAQEIQLWKQNHGYDKPEFFNSSAEGLKKITDTLFFTKSLSLFAFQFGSSVGGRNIGHDISKRMWPSLALAIPTLFIGLLVNITVALLVTLFKGSLFERFSLFACIVMMSVSGLFYIIFGQFLLGKTLKLVPVSGFQEGWSMMRFLILPVLIGVVSGMGTGIRWYRTLFLEEVNKDYVQAARARGLSELQVMFKHVLKNAMIPILTGVVVIIPTLFLGSLIMESFFSIPGLGSYTIEAIHKLDFNVVRVMVFLGTLLYIVGLILTDISYAIVDPRVKFK
jgi:peptide/nickel transport system permease protein